MCGRFEGVDETWEELHELLGGFAQLPREIAARYADREIRPTNQYPILVRRKPTEEDEKEFEVREARWSLVPFWHKGTLKEWKATTINAMIEEAATKASFRAPWKSKHCLVPVRSFWEWKVENPEAPKSKQVKTRYCITRTDNHPMVFAGLWETADLTDGPVTSFTILTRPNGEDMAGLHTREPVMLDPDQWQGWMKHDPMPDLPTPTTGGRYRTAVEQRAFA